MLNQVEACSRDGDPPDKQLIDTLKRVLLMISESNLPIERFQVSCDMDEMRGYIHHYLIKRDPQVLLLSQQVCTLFPLRSFQFSHIILTSPIPGNIQYCAYVPIFELKGTLITGEIAVNGSKRGICMWLDHESGCLTALPSLNDFRHFHGMAYLNGHVYVFGGEIAVGLPLNSAERFYVHGDLLNTPWTSLPSPMIHCRFHINPSVYERLVYLGAGGHPSIEVYLSWNHSFHLLPVKLLDSGPCIMVLMRLD